MISLLFTFIVNCICSWISLWQSFKEEFHSSQFAWSSRKRTNTSCKYKYRRVMWVWTFFSLHLIKFQKESWQIQNWLQPVSAHYWLEKTVEPRRKWKWFGHKNHLIWTQKVFVQPWDSFAAALVFDLRRNHMFTGICYWETNICEYWWIFAYNWIHIKGSLNDF